jgi:hypothetical protein
MVHPAHFRSYDVYDQSPFETQFVWWMQTLRNQPWGGQVWPFGNNWVESTDGWVAQGKATLVATSPGSVVLSDRTPMNKIAMRSPSVRLSGKTWLLQVKGTWPDSKLTADANLDNKQVISVKLDRTGGTGRLTPPWVQSLCCDGKGQQWR